MSATVARPWRSKNNSDELFLSRSHKHCLLAWIISSLVYTRREIILFCIKIDSRRRPCRSIIPRHDSDEKSPPPLFLFRSYSKRKIERWEQVLSCVEYSTALIILQLRTHNIAHIRNRQNWQTMSTSNRKMFLK